MRFLIDTHILIWHLEDDEQLSFYYGQLIENPANSIFVSIVSFWEIAIKSSLGKLSLSRSIDEIVLEIERSTSTVLPIEPTHTIRVAQLPFLHKDPFDRMIIAQALSEDFSIMTADPEFEPYGVVLL
jgi:PIN domain nuclease of toxin-antitoxin system